LQDGEIEKITDCRLNNLKTPKNFVNTQTSFSSAATTVATDLSSVAAAPLNTVEKNNGEVNQLNFYILIVT
jgi:hypothetical protein